jgi:metal-sulfur cluster biosynthetic enzyme
LRARHDDREAEQQRRAHEQCPDRRRRKGRIVTARVLETCDGSVSRAQVWAALDHVDDPELPLSITDLGLVRRLEIAAGRIRVGLTYTSLACPCNEMIREDVETAVAAVPGVVAVQVDEVLEPWSRDDLTPRGRELLRAVAVV